MTMRAFLSISNLESRSRRMKALMCLLMTAFVLPAGCATHGMKSASMEEQWGVEVQSLRLTAGGYMLDFRYKVTDPEAAKPLLNRQVKPFLIDHASGGKFLVPDSPKVGALRQSTREPVAGKHYFMFFANPGKFLKPGSTVTVVIGDFRAENLMVE